MVYLYDACDQISDLIASKLMEEEGAGYVIFYINDLLCVCVTGHSTNCVFIFLIFIPSLPERGKGEACDQISDFCHQ
jgi:hypothetical protein